jgi:hypothetical protein
MMVTYVRGHFKKAPVEDAGLEFTNFDRSLSMYLRGFLDAGFSIADVIGAHGDGGATENLPPNSTMN